MALSPIPSPPKTSAHSSSRLKQKRELEFKKKKNKHLTKKLTLPVCKPLSKEEEENALQLVKCNDQKIDSFSQPVGPVYKNLFASQRANEVRDNLEQVFPSFVKPMLKSHVTGGFWLGLPVEFCRKNLPMHDEAVTLINENDKAYETKYLAGKTGLSGGWRGFSISHNLLEGDVLVFQLIKEWKFKVFIVRASDPTEIDGAISLLNLHVEPKPIAAIVEEDELLMQENVESPSSSSEQAYYENAEDLDSDIEEIGYYESTVNFKDVKNFEGFKILVDGFPVDSEVDESTRTKYYELCCSQQCFLHERLIGGLNFKLVAGIISETVNVADAIRAAKLITPLGDLTTWDKTLKSFEELGMTVGFLRERVSKLNSISHEQKQKVETKTCERKALENELTSLKLKQLEVERAMRIVDEELKALKVDDKRLALKFKEAASASF